MLNIKISIINDFIKYFNTSEIEEKSKHTGFTKRNDGKLSPITFIKAFTLGLWGHQHATLQQVAQICENAQPGLRITKQALHQRLKSGTSLLKNMLETAMSYALRNSFRIHDNGILGWLIIFIFAIVHICLYLIN